MGRIKVRRMLMGGEGIWGGTSWISLRSVRFLEVYTKPKTGKAPPLESLQSLANTVHSITWCGHDLRAEDGFVKWRINISSDTVLLVNGKRPCSKLSRPQSNDVHQIGFMPIWWHGQDLGFQVSRGKHWPPSQGKVCVQNALLTLHFIIALCLPGCVKCMEWTVFSSGRNKLSPSLSTVLLSPLFFAVLCDVSLLCSVPSQLGGWRDVLGPDSPVG